MEIPPRVRSFLAGTFGTDVTVLPSAVYEEGSRVTIPTIVKPTGRDSDQEARYVLRSDRSDGATGSLSLRSERDLLEHLSTAGVDTPEPLGFLDRGAGDRRPWLVMEYVPGWTPTVSKRWVRETLYDSWLRRRDVAWSFVESLAAVHSLSPSEVPDLDASPLSEVRRSQLDYWRRELETADYYGTGVLAEALRWLETNVPNTEVETLIHGDYRAGNLRLAESEVTAVLDWEFARIGDPMYDLGFTSVRYYAGRGTAPVKEPDLASGIAERTWLYDTYDRLVRHEVRYDDILYWRIFCAFLLACTRLQAAYERETGPSSLTDLENRYESLGHLDELLNLLGTDLLKTASYSTGTTEAQPYR